ncbi:hypothetical protein E4U54_008546 [Claviceps lovelessii]|nr:hypothetical protein E4U54_008546 [Claviceps lovelessii]
MPNMEACAGHQNFSAREPVALYCGNLVNMQHGSTDVGGIGGMDRSSSDLLTSQPLPLKPEPRGSGMSLRAVLLRHP